MTQTEQNFAEMQTETENQPKQPTKKSKLRWLWRCLALLLLALSLLLFALSTEKGQHTALHLTTKWVKGFSLEQAEGKLQDGLLLKNAAFKMDGVEVTLGQALLKARLSCLLQAKLCVENLALQETAVVVETDKLPPSKQKVKKPNPNWLNLPIEINLEQVSSHNLSVKVDELDIFLNQLEGGISGVGKHLVLNPTKLSDLTVSLAPQAGKNEEKSAKSSEPIDWVELENKLAQPWLSRRESLSLPLTVIVEDLNANNIQLERKVKSPSGEWLVPTSLIKVTNAAIQGRVVDDAFALEKLDIQSDKGNLSASGQMAFQQNFPFNLQLNTENLAWREFMPDRQAEIALSGELFGKTALHLQSKGTTNTSLHGSVSLAEPKTPFELSLKSEQFSYPIAAEKNSDPLKFKGVDLTLNGDLLDYQLAGQIGISGKGLPAGNLSLNASGGVTKFKIDELNFASQQGKGNFIGEANWRDKLNAEFVTDLAYAGNLIVADGKLNETLDFSADIYAPHFEALIPALKADVNGKIRMQGSLAEPNLEVDLTANQLNYQQIELKQFSAKGKIATQQQIQGDLTLALKQLAIGDMKVEKADLLLNGNEEKHSLKFAAQGEPVGLDLQISGNFDREQQRWQGQLSNAAIQSPIGRFQNDKSVQLAYSHSQLNSKISPHCWRNEKTALCFSQPFEVGKTGKIPFEINQFDFALLKELLGEKLRVTGILNAEGDVAWFSDKPLQANLEMNAPHLKLEQKIDGNYFPLSFSPLKLTAKLADNRANLKTELKLEENGQLKGDFLLSGMNDKRQLSGKLDIDRLNLNLLKPLLRQDEQINGNINARLTLAGSLSAPQLLGNLNLAELKAKSSIMPFDIVGGGLNLKFNGVSSTLNGEIKSNESVLYLNGDANWQKLDAWHTRISAKANKFRLDIPSIAKVDISPDIEVKATPKELSLSGEIAIPWARIEVQELPESAVSVSRDEIIMDGKGRRKSAIPKVLKGESSVDNGMVIKSDVAINIGNDVHLEAYGLKTNLYGQIKVSQGNKGLGLYGQVNLKNGTFASFGQDLVIRKGLISFTGLPSQPTIDLEAIRNPETMEDSSITAGVRVTGIADALEVKPFSSPSMPQDQALSYILTGRALDSSGDSTSSNSLAAALIGMSLSKGSKTVGKVGSAFGIEDLNVTTAGIGDNTKVVVAGSLSPRFKVKYGVGIFAPLTELTLRYRLAPSLYLQWVSSVNQAVDLLYRFEF